MPESPIVDIVNRIAERSHGLSPTERRVAQYILADLPRASAASIADLAQGVGVSTASISRFAKLMGCVDVRELKRWLAQASAIGTRFLDTEEVSNPTEDTVGTIHQDIVATLAANRSLVQAHTARSAAQSIRKARMTYLFGMGGTSTFLADEARFRLARFGLPVATYQDAVLQRMVAATMDAKCVVVVFSATGQVEEVLASARIAREYGAGVIAITPIGAPLADLAHIHLPIRTLETDFILKPSSSRYAMLMVLDVLATEVALLDPKRSRESLRRTKYMLDQDRGGDDRQPLGD